MDIKALAAMLQGMSPVQQVGDVVRGPWAMDRRGTEGAMGPRMGGGSLQGWLTQRGVPRHQVEETLRFQQQQGLSDQQIKYQRSMWEQQKAAEQATLDRKTGVDPELRKAFMEAAKLRPLSDD